MNILTIIWGLIKRELKIMKRRPIYLLGSVAVIAFCAVFFLTFFSKGLPSELPIALVDADHSSFTRHFTREFNTTKLAKFVEYDNYSTAREDLLKGKVNAICLIPENYYENMISGKNPKISYYINSLYFIGGALSYRELLTMLNTANAGVMKQFYMAKGLSDKAIMARLKPIRIDCHQIGNGYTNYSYYLCNVLLPGVLEMVVIIILIYALGAELKYGTSKHLLEKSKSSIMLAITGKLIVYTLLFWALGIILIFLLYHFMGFPIRGSIWNMIIDIMLLVLASEGIAIFIIGCLPITRLALSIGALYSVLAFSLSGFTLPVEAMPSFIQAWAAAFPLRHYYLFYIQEVIFAGGFAAWWPQVVYLLAFTLLPATILIRLKKAYLYQNFPKE